MGIVILRDVRYLLNLGKRMDEIMKIAVAGTGYVGLVAGVCFAEKGHEVICVDVNKEKIESMKRGISLIYEENLEVLMVKNYEAGRINYTIDYHKAYKNADANFI